MDRYPSDATIRSVSVYITHKIIEDVALLALWGGNEMERKNIKSGKSANVWIHNLGLGGSLLCPVFQRTLHTFIQKLEKIQFWQLCYLPLQKEKWYTAISSDKCVCLQDIKHTIAWHTQDPCFIQKHSDSVGHEKAGDSRVGNREASCLSWKKKT